MTIFTDTGELGVCVLNRVPSGGKKASVFLGLDSAFVLSFLRIP